jgi:hypothetical protein
MVKFPADLDLMEDLETLFRRTVSRSSMGRSAVRVPQLPRLRQIVFDISRTPAGERVRETYRQVNMWTDESVSSTFLPGTGSAALLRACASEASALLELGYRRQDGIDFVTSFPSPVSNPVRPLTQIRSAIHHMGGDMALFMDMLNNPQPSSPELKLVFSIWPTGGRLPDAWRPGQITVPLHLSVKEAPVPLVVSFSERLKGYALLCIWDLAKGLAGKNTGIKLIRPSFQAFAEEFFVTGRR